MEKDIFYMNQALNLAQKALGENEVPVGSLILHKGKVLSEAYNQRETQQNPLGHAELSVLKQASEKLASWRLEDCEIYVTLEPCLMCMGAILQSRISRLVYGCSDFKTGFDSFYQLRKYPQWSDKLKITNGIQEEECSQILKQFFKKIREK